VKVKERKSAVWELKSFQEKQHVIHRYMYMLLRKIQIIKSMIYVYILI